MVKKPRRSLIYVKTLGLKIEEVEPILKALSSLDVLADYYFCLFLYASTIERRTPIPMNE